LVRWLYYYQPLLWWLRRALQLNQDYLADYQAAVRGTASEQDSHLASLREDYAEFLTAVAAGSARAPLAAGLGIVGPASDLKRRVIMLVKNRRALELVGSRTWNAVPLLVAAMALALIGTLRAESGADPKTIPPPEAKPEAKAAAEEPVDLPPAQPRARAAS